MARPKRNIMAVADETSSPPATLTQTQSIARIIKAEGNNLYSCSLPKQEKNHLVELPSRFRNTIWLKRGSYVLIDTKEANNRQNKINGEIINILRDEHIWRKQTYWCFNPLIHQPYLANDCCIGPRNLPKLLTILLIQVLMNRIWAKCPLLIQIVNNCLYRTYMYEIPLLKIVWVFVSEYLIILFYDYSVRCVFKIFLCTPPYTGNNK